MGAAQPIIVVIACVVMVILGIFKWHELSLRDKYMDRTQRLYNQIEMQSAQIEIRKNALNLYDFLSYNISEALKIQWIIKLDSNDWRR